MKLINCTCPLCGECVIDFFEVPYSFFRHLDFEVIKRGGTLSKCSRCQLVMNYVSETDEKEISDMFLSREYVKCQLMAHTINTEKNKAPSTRSALQANLLQKKINVSNPVVLDVGCFSGELLLELDCVFDNAELHGFDLSDDFIANCPSGKNFHYWTKGLEEIDESFDLIILSASIMYIKDITGLMSQIKRLLKSNGMVFVHAADISKNPYAILLGDQFYHYTPTIMKNLWGRFGFNFALLDGDQFPRELAGFAYYDKNMLHDGFDMKEDSTLQDCLDELNDIYNRLKISTKEFCSLGVLGTTSSAAFVDSVLGEKVTFFVDENPARVGVEFHGKHVFHPSELDNDDVVIIAYGSVGSERIQKRLSDAYKGRYVCV